MRTRVVKKIKTAAAVLAAAVAIFSAAGAIAADPIWKQLDAAQLEKLLDGGRVGFVDRAQRPGKELAVSGVIVNATPDKVWNILADFESYPKMINQITRVKVIEKKSDFAVVQFYMFLIKLGPVKIQSDYIQKWKYEKPKKITIVSLDEKNVKKKKYNETADPADAIVWELVPTADGKRTMLFHTTISDIAESGVVGKYLVERQPTIQIGFDLANALIQTEAVKTRAAAGK
jgi:uncharacterized protein YndB with AHSA1/START domain